MIYFQVGKSSISFERGFDAVRSACSWLMGVSHLLLGLCGCGESG